MKNITHPALMMTGIWFVVTLLFYLSPISYVHAPGIAAWSIIGGGVAIFCAGAIVGTRVGMQPAGRSSESSLDCFVIVCAAIGFVGIAAMLVDKVYLSDIDWSHGLNVARERRNVEVLQDISPRRSWLLYIGYLTFSFSCVAATAFVLTSERLRPFGRLCGQASVLPMAIYAVLYGGRIPILIVILLAIGAGITRGIQGKAVVPPRLWWKLIALAIALFVYTNYVWQARREMNRTDSYDVFLAVAASNWEMQPSPWLNRAVRAGTIPAGQAMDWLSSDMYLTHSPTTVQRFVEHWSEISVYGGLYQIGVLSPLSGVLAPSLMLPQKMRAELRATGIYGWFPSAWAAWIGDAGLIGGAICVFLWGALSGIWYRRVITSSSLGAQLMLSFAYMTIIASPINGPFGISNSFLIFLSFVVASAWLSCSAGAKTSAGLPTGTDMLHP
jgi:hypothetical protein